MARYQYRHRHSLISLLVLLLSGLFYFGQQQGWFSSAGQAVESNQPGLYSINHFVDGDTVAVNMNSRVETIRFIGVDTPETHKPNTPVQCYGPAAAAYTKNLIGHSSVRLESDSLSTNRDRYNRLLRYVYLANGTLVNEKLIQNGYGFYYPYFPFSKSQQFAADQQQAMAQHKGLWAACHPTPTDKGGYISNPEGS